jgi:hypothetical protein
MTKAERSSVPYQDSDVPRLSLYVGNLVAPAQVEDAQAREPTAAQNAVIEAGLAAIALVGHQPDQVPDLLVGS